MPINQNHLCEDLNGIKCSIVEKNVSGERVEFLRKLLEYNRYIIVVVPSPPPETFTVGVTDTMFNPVNAIFGRLLRTPDGHVVTLAYWQQKDRESRDEIPYFETQ